MNLFPKVGLRSIKTAISATLCAIIYSFFDRNATFACIGAVFGMNNDIKSSWKSGGNRLVGTVIGGFVGMGFFWLYKANEFSIFGWKIPLTFYLFVGIVVLILVSQTFHVSGSIQAGSVVFYIVMLNTPANEYVTYALNRMLDTGVGVIMSILVNVAIPRDFIDKITKKYKTLDSIIEEEANNKEAIMTELTIFDKKDYDENWQTVNRNAVRAVILDGNYLYMVKSFKEGYYKFPGGGVETGESFKEALVREIKEETGLTAKADTFKEFGHIAEKRQGINGDEIFINNSYYYFVEVYDFISEQELDEYEKDLEFKLEKVEIQKAYEINKELGKEYGSDFINREAFVLKLLLDRKMEDNNG